jgi:hypothetical protein
VRRIAVFARPVEVGQVKTRLSPALPPALAAELYSAMLADTLDAALDCAADERVVWWSEGAQAGAPPSRFTVREQSGADLGERLAHAVDAMLQAAGDRLVVIGSDAPALRGAHLEKAFESLGSHDLVLGPTTDGGYWLIGFSRPAHGVFEGIAWSTEGVFAQTLAAAARLGLRVHALEMLDDLDTPADLVRLVAAAATGDAARFGPHATAALGRMGMLPG